MADRGAFNEITFMRCARGFMLRTCAPQSGMVAQMFAFDRIEDLAAWLVEQYTSPPPTADGGLTAAQRGPDCGEQFRRLVRENITPESGEE